MSFQAMDERSQRRTWKIDQDNTRNIWPEAEEANTEFKMTDEEIRKYLDKLVFKLASDFQTMLEHYEDGRANWQLDLNLFKDFKFTDYWPYGTESLFCVNSKIVSVHFYRNNERRYVKEWGGVEVIGPSEVIDIFKKAVQKAKEIIDSDAS